MRPVAALAALFPLAWLVGCAGNAKYEIVSPIEASGPIPRDVGATFPRDRIEYEVYQVDEKVVLRFVNRTQGPLRLTEQSTMTDAKGRAFIVDAQDIAPDQSGRLVVPPGPAASTDEPRRPIATEVHVGGVDEGGILRRRDENVARPEPTRSTLFDWPGGQTARFHLIFDVNGTPLIHDWILRRD